MKSFKTGWKPKVGIWPTYEKISVLVENGFFDEGIEADFIAGMKEYIHDFYEECKCEVLTDEEFQDRMEAERCEEDYLRKLDEEYEKYLEENKDDLDEIMSEKDFEQYLQDVACEQMESMAEGE